jgi:tripeptidyl-peptidase II
MLSLGQMLALCSFVLAAPALQDPLQAQLPKEDLGVRAFLEAHPEYDGRGIRVAILDTGIDPGHPFLQRSSTGGRKIVDWYDATTDGRLQIQHTSKPQGTLLMGLSGRVLELGRHYVPGASYGMIRLDQDWLPDDLEGRLQADRRADWQKGKQQWHDDKAAGALASTETDLAAAERAHDYEKFVDDGPVWDLLVFEKDGTRYVVVDNDRDGNLDEEPALASFRESGDWATLGDEALMNYAVGFEGDSGVHVFFDAHGHGTHVGGIVGAFEGPGGRMNGIAPGVELVSIKIGDGKFGGSTSGYSISKALDYAVEAGCQVVNMSFGGPSFAADGREPDAWAVEEATRRGLCVVTSAGNEGPALTTVGAPATTTAAFSIAAAIWPDTQRSNYSSLSPSEPVLFDFSSRGPLPNGAIGIDYAAPGAALSPLPSWGITKGENWNGTSMAAPQMAGCIALLHCAARAEGLSRTPARIDRALQLSARPLAAHAWVEQGHGFISMEPALAALRSLHETGHLDQQYSVTANNAFGEGAGVYLRGVASRRALEVPVRIAPIFEETTPNAVKADFLRTFEPTTEVDWVQAPALLYASANGSTIPIRVDASRLAPGLHSTRVLLYDVDQPRGHGAEIIIPVTVIVPEFTDPADEHRWSTRTRLAPGQLSRSFLQVPAGAHALKLRVTQLGGGRNEIRAGAGSVSGTRYAGDRQARGRYFLEDGQSYETTVPVEVGTVFEYAMAARWATNTPAEYLLEAQFVGVSPQAATVVVPAGQDYAYLAWQSLLSDQDIAVSGTIDGYAVPVLAPLEIEADPIRPILGMGKRMFQGVRRWTSEVPVDGCNLVLRMPHSIQTTELREDLMLVVRDQKGQVLHRHIAYEIDTDLGHFDAGSYDFELIFPALGARMVESAYAGAELRFQSGGGSCRVATDLEAALGGDSGSRLRIPFGGSRLSIVAPPQLAALAAGAYWYGSIRAEAGGETVGRAELRVERPMQILALPELAEADPAASASTDPSSQEAATLTGGDPDAPDASDASSQQASEAEAVADPALAAAQAYQDACMFAGTPEGKCKRVLAARAWKAADPLNPEAELAIYLSLNEGGLVTRARSLSRGFLTRFPRQLEVFLDHAKRWN